MSEENLAITEKVGEFVGKGGTAYYQREFQNIEQSCRFLWVWNTGAFFFGPLWAAWRGLWGFFCLSFLAELISLIQIAKGLWGDALGEQRLRHQQILSHIAERKEQWEQMIAQGNEAGAQSAAQIMANLQKVADQLQEQWGSGEQGGLLWGGVFLFALVKLAEGVWANRAYERCYRQWRMGSPKKAFQTSAKALASGCFLLLATWPLTIFSFISSHPEKVKLGGVSLGRFPLKGEIFSPLSAAIDRGFDWMGIVFGDLFLGLTSSLSFLIELFESVLLKTPWPVVMVVSSAMVWLLVGRRQGIFLGGTMVYLALLGLWEASIVTLALIGTGTLLSLVLGIPLGFWFGRQRKAYTMALPVLDFMQTMPTFVYLIPIIAFFGTGKSPGVLATVIFAMPPVVRLTALGIRNVPSSTKEAALAFGCSPWQLLRHVEIPLAGSSIMAGVNQTIMMSLSMTVVASLIGAEGLGALILEALQYAAKGQGLLAGVGILLCAMVIDSIVQGVYKGKNRH